MRGMSMGMNFKLEDSRIFAADMRAKPRLNC